MSILKTESNMAKSILMLHGSSDIYGAGEIFFNTATLLKENGYNVFVVLSEDGLLGGSFRSSGITVIILKLAISGRKYLNLKGMINHVRLFNKARKALNAIIDENEIEMIYSNTAAVMVGAFVARSRKIKHIWHLHEIIESPLFLNYLLGFLINRYSDKVIVISDELKKHWNKYVSHTKLVTIHNGLDYLPFTSSISSVRGELGIQDDQILIGMVAKVNLWKVKSTFLSLLLYSLRNILM
jgi:hypothetical protein